MKQLPRRLFFWDAPAQGAFFGMTLLPATVWLVFSALCCIEVINYHLFIQCVPIYIFFLIIILTILAYEAFLIVRMPFLICLKTMRFGRRVLVPLALIVVSLLYGAAVMYQDEMCWKWVLSMSLVVGGVYLFCPKFFSSWKMMVGTLAWAGAFHVFWTVFIYACAPAMGGWYNEWCMTSGVIRFIPYVDALHKWFRLTESGGCLCFTALGFILLAAGYLLYGCLLAGYAKTSLRGMFSGAVCLVWGVVAASYVVFLLMAFCEVSACRRAVKELEEYYGHPMTAAELERQFYEGRQANPEFWKEVENLCSEYYNSLDENVWRFYSWYQFAVLPEGMHLQRKKRFLENTPCQKLEQMIASPIPPPERNYADDQLLMAMQNPEFPCLRKITQMAMLRVRYCLEDGDFAGASAAIDRMDACRECLWKDHAYAAYLVGIAITNNRLQAMERIMASDLPTEEWLAAQSERLAEIEHEAEQLEGHFMYGESVCLLNLFHWTAHYAGTIEASPSGLNFHSLRFCFPQGWWLAANNVKGFAKAIRVFNFTPLPQGGTGNILVDLLMPAYSKGFEKKRCTIASCRIMRGLIQAELRKRSTGVYPESLDGLPEDPFSGQPLKYRKGTCQVVEYVYKEKKEDDENDDSPDKNYLDHDSDYMKRLRTVDAVQIWSVGPNSVDDGGEYHLDENGSPEKDDIRYVIPLNAEKPSH